MDMTVQFNLNFTLNKNVGVIRAISSALFVFNPVACPEEACYLVSHCWSHVTGTIVTPHIWMPMEQMQRMRKDSMLIIFPAPVLFQSQSGEESDHPGSSTTMFLRSPGPVDYSGVLVLIEFCPLTPGLLVEELRTY